ncbi:DUF4251 domain-containing protein [Candidatus Sulfidibacterium hydrothermale]|uniref:DUF4251 domain-containing protein n=1 Tax=Candidatus Sulfidibacterium hydrothermale TaxID=2875962 RepID=UPI001F0A7650|nr:DUF4251 domain-containing protein [Candidatus Sulfidibacterium hydrothermale]UBM61196.1 DUF4251 domain-containing protein [Candidatus Sulfidibacterium hydrothermale]
MKRLKYFSILLLAIGLLISPVAMAQTQHTLTKKEQRQLEKMRRKKEKTRQRAAAHAYYLQLLQKKYFVFEADYLTDTRGNSFVLSPDINFMEVIGDTAVLQFGFDNLIGWNGVGGITVRGTLYNYKVQEGKKNTGINMHTGIHIIGPGLPPNVSLYVSDDGTAQLTIITGNGDQITLFGTIVSPEDASIFKGMSLF